jgi:hypothetical protein
MVLVATALLTGGTFAAASAASATTPPPDGGSWDHVWTTSDDSPHGGTVSIEEYGDYVQLCDTAADGLTPHVTVSYPGGTYTLTASGGNGSCTAAGAVDGGSYNLPENDEIAVSVYLGSHQYETTHEYLNDH